jgi:hypothetical protein
MKGRVLGTKVDDQSFRMKRWVLCIQDLDGLGKRRLDGSMSRADRPSSAPSVVVGRLLPTRSGYRAGANGRPSPASSGRCPLA